MSDALASQSLRIRGVVIDHAVVGNTGFTGGKPSAALCLKVMPPKGLSYDIRQDLGTDPNAHIAAQAKAKLLKRGATVTVYCAGLRVRIDSDQALLQAQDVSDVIPGELPPHHATQAIDRTQERAIPATTPTEKAA